MARRRRRWAQDGGDLRLHGLALTPSLLAALALCRTSHDGAALLLFGAALFAAAGMPASLREEARRRAHRIARVAIPTVAVTALLRVPLAAAAMGNGWPDALDGAALRAVLSDTAFGRAWLLHGVAVALLASCGLPGLRGRMAPLACASGLVVASLALVGHGATRDGVPGAIDRATQALHLLAAGAWIGALPEVLALMRRLSDRGPDAEAGRALRRFSSAGHGAVALVIATGMASTLAIADSPRDLLVTPYGLVLAAKVVLVSVMVGLAVINRYGLVPQLAHEPAKSARALIGNTRSALALGLGAVLAAGLLGLLDPG